MIPGVGASWCSGGGSDSVLPTQGAWVRSLLRELDAYAVTRTWCSQINKCLFFKKIRGTPKQVEHEGVHSPC